MKQEKKVTIKDIARLSGVSSYTVSKILSGQPEAAAKTQKRVWQVVKRLNYKPDPLAQGMRRKSLKEVTILLPYAEGRFSTLYFDQMLSGINDAAIENDYYILIVIENENKYKNQEEFYSALNNNPLFNNIIVIAPDKSEIKRLKSTVKDKRIILINARDDEIPFITINNYKLMYELVTHLIQKGYKTIGYLDTNNRNYDVDERLKAYKDALKDHNLTFSDSLLANAEFNNASVTDAVDLLLANNKNLRAIVTFSDLFAVFVLKILFNKGIRIPEQIAVTGFDNIKYSELTIPALTTIKQPLYEMGRAAFELVRTYEDFRFLEFDGEILYRESS